MKKIMLVLLVGFVSLWAENYAGVLPAPEKEGGTLGNIINKSAYFIYRNTNINTSNISLLRDMNSKNLCESKDMRSLIVDKGLAITYLYLQKDGNALVTVTDNCEGYPAKK